MKMNFINFCDAKIFKSISTSSSTSLQLPLPVVRHEDWWRKTFAILWMENEVIGNESKFIRLIFFVHFFTSANCACLTSLGEICTSKFSHNFQFYSHKSVLKILSKWKERRKFFEKMKKNLRRNDDDDGLPSRDLSSLYACQINSIWMFLILLFIPLMLIFDAWKSWNEF